MLKITYLGRTTFALEANETTLLLNPGIWEGEPVAPGDFQARVVIATNHADDAIGMVPWKQDDLGEGVRDGREALALAYTGA